MSMAIITQTESNTVNGGSIQGYLSGTDSTAAADTFYPRRLTNMWVNETFSGTPTVDTFTASTGGSGVASTAGTFVLVPGTYRIYIDASYNIVTDLTASVIFGLYNITSAAFEVYSGTSEPILGTVLVHGGTTSAMSTGRLASIVAVTSSNKTFQISHKISHTTDARELTCCGIKTSMTGTNVNSAAAKNVYCIVKIIRTA